MTKAKNPPAINENCIDCMFFENGCDEECEEYNLYGFEDLDDYSEDDLNWKEMSYYRYPDKTSWVNVEPTEWDAYLEEG